MKVQAQVQTNTIQWEGEQIDPMLRRLCKWRKRGVGSNAWKWRWFKDVGSPLYLCLLLCLRHLLKLAPKLSLNLPRKRAPKKSWRDRLMLSLNLSCNKVSTTFWRKSELHLQGALSGTVLRNSHIQESFLGDLVESRRKPEFSLDNSLSALSPNLSFPSLMTWALRRSYLCFEIFQGGKWVFKN